jgi:hemerythrin-like domain-containing protein
MRRYILTKTTTFKSSHIEALYNQHKKILSLFNDTLEKIKENEKENLVIQNLQKINNLVKIHHQKEDQLVYNKLLSKLEENKKDRVSEIYLSKNPLIQRLSRLKNRYNSLEIIRNEEQDIYNECETLKNDWLVHIKEEEREIYGHIEKYLVEKK